MTAAAESYAASARASLRINHCMTPGEAWPDSEVGTLDLEAEPRAERLRLSWTGRGP